MQTQLLQHAVDLAVPGFISRDPNLGTALVHLNGERALHMDLPRFLQVDKFEASVARIIGDDRRSYKTLEVHVAEAVCQRLAALFAVPPVTLAARCRFMTGSDRGEQPVGGLPRFSVTLRWKSH
jgi:hypothetical protein